MTYWSCLLYCSHFGYAINICICTCWLCNYLLISNMLTMRQGARTSCTCLLNIPHRRSRAVLCVFMTDNYFFNQGKPAGYWQNPKTGRYQEPLFSQFSSETAPVSKHHFIWSICTMYFHLCCCCNNMDCWCNSVFHLSIQVNNTLQITNYWEKWIPLISKRWLAPPAGRSRGLQQSNLWKKKSKTFRCRFDAPETTVKSKYLL